MDVGGLKRREKKRKGMICTVTIPEIAMMRFLESFMEK